METESLVQFDVLKANHQRILEAFRTKSVEEICREIENHYMIVPKVLFEEMQKKKNL